MSGNMAYCRFQNTLRDLRDCEEALGDGLDELSGHERRDAINLIRLAQRIAENYGHLVQEAKPKEGAGT